jgi:uncharacterized protein YunC (DUF1805 family)
VIDIKRINSGLGIRIQLQNANFLLISAKRGYIMCGYLNMETAEKLGDAACIVTGVDTFEDVLKAEVVKVSESARILGCKEGMTGKEALNLLSNEP